MYAKRLSGCGSGTEYLAVTPWGDFYPCHQFVGQEEFLMGNVDDGISPGGHPGRVQVRATCTPRKNAGTASPEFYCSGGCAANSWNFHHSINDAYDIGCELERKRVECAIMIKAALAEDEA